MHPLSPPRTHPLPHPYSAPSVLLLLPADEAAIQELQMPMTHVGLALRMHCRLLCAVLLFWCCKLGWEQFAVSICVNCSGKLKCPCPEPNRDAHLLEACNIGAWLLRALLQPGSWPMTDDMINCLKSSTIKWPSTICSSPWLPFCIYL